MSEAPSTSQECNLCNKHVAVVTLGHLVLCSECNNVLFPATLPPLTQDPTEEDFTKNLDWGEIFKTTEDNNIEFDDEAYGALIQSLSERDACVSVTTGAPTVVEAGIEKLKTFENCGMCEDSIVTGEICKKLPCGHRYHGNCIVTWLEISSCCPLC